MPQQTKFLQGNNRFNGNKTINNSGNQHIEKNIKKYFFHSINFNIFAKKVLYIKY